MDIVIHVIAWMAFVGVIGFFITGAMKKFPKATPVVVVTACVCVVGYAAWLLLR